ncbi:MAG: radical SAM protein [Candidatus Lokiarchaeota archaeon]
MDGKKIARYLIAKSIKCDFNADNSLGELQELLKNKSNEFQRLMDLETENLQNRDVQKNSYIDLVVHLAKRYLKHCILCERRCGINRLLGEKGVCLLTQDAYVSSAFLHWGEESVLVPSGTIFFQSCNFECVFCQNYDISQSWKNKRKLDEIARKVNPKDLANIAKDLGKKGALNINYVGGDPIPNLYTILRSLLFQDDNICQLWNSNFYMTEESLALILHLIDFWLPDFKYGNNKCARKLSGIDNYYDILTRNLKIIHDIGSGEIIIRHLVMPNHVECCSKPILDFIAKEIPKAFVNIMGQYRPVFKASNFPEINRRPTSDEMTLVQNYANQLEILWKPVS